MPGIGERIGKIHTHGAYILECEDRQISQEIIRLLIKLYRELK